MQESVRGTKINKLVMEGFKSFARRTELIFDSHFSCVLGPNGSGKSNVSDALCFVLGKSSSKQLRAEKSAHLIYNGGKAKKGANSAEVSIFFDNTNKNFPVEEDQVKITRIVRKDGASKYKINNKTVTRQEVLELLRAAKINPDGYNIIMQGDIIRIVEMNPVERRQIVEEIAGIGVYEEKKAQALKELEKVDNRLNEAEIVLKERASYLKELKKERDQAIIYKETREHINTYKATLLHTQHTIKENELKKLQDRSAKITEKIRELKEKAAIVQQDASRTKEALAQLNQEIEQKGEIEASDLQKTIETLKVGIATSKERSQSLRDALARIEKQKQELKETFKDVKAKTEELEKEKEEKQAIQKEVENKLKIIEQKMNAFKKKKGLDNAHELEEDIEKIDKELETVQNKVHELRERQQQALRDKDRTEYQLQTIQQQEEAHKDMLAKHKKELEELKEKRAGFKRTAQELNELLNRDSKEAKELGSIKKQLQEQREELAKLEVKSAQMKAASIDVLSKKIKENLKGVIGTVAELGEVDDRYSLALEVAAGAKIHSIVVENDTVAKNAISYLRERKLGVATFLPLNKLKSRKIDKAPAKTQRAIDLVQYSPEYKNVFSLVLGNTLVMPNIDQARRLTGKYRMVTLQGDLLEKAGSITGGFRRRKAAFKEKDLTKKIEQTTKKIAQLEEKESMLAKNRSITDERIAEVRTQKASLEGEIIKMEKSLHIIDYQEGEDYKKQLEQKKKDLDKTLDELREQIEEHTTTITKYMSKRQNLRDQTRQIRNPTVLAELHAFDQQKQSLQEQNAKLIGDIHAFDLRITQIIGSDAEKQNKTKEELMREEKTIKEQLDALQKSISDQEKTLREKEKAQEKANTQFKGLFEKRDKLMYEINQFERKQLMLEEESRREEMNENTVSIESARIKTDMANINEQMAQYAGVKLDTTKDAETLRRLVSEGEKKLASIGNVNLRALDVYEAAEKEFNKLNEKKEVLLKEKELVIQLMQDIEKNKSQMFLKTFDSINEHFQRIFEELNPKGRTATLTLNNREDPFAQGMSMRVEVSKGKHLDIRSLSGGEKTMTALSFLFAVQEHDPASFYVMDEVDAALDKANSEKLAQLIHRYSKKAQYIIISHNDALISEADVLYGISMNPDAGRSNVVSLKA